MVEQVDVDEHHKNCHFPVTCCVCKIIREVENRRLAEWAESIRERSRILKEWPNERKGGAKCQ